MGAALSRCVSRVPIGAVLPKANVRAAAGATWRQADQVMLANNGAGPGANTSPHDVVVAQGAHTDERPRRCPVNHGAAVPATATATGHPAANSDERKHDAGATTATPPASTKPDASAARPAEASPQPYVKADPRKRYTTAWILHNIGGSARLRAMATRFYDKAFRDSLLDTFIEDHADPHGERLGNWVAEKMGGEGRVWSASRPGNARGVAHRRAWHSHKRPASSRGRRFKLDDCRVWMRLMFWAARDEGLHRHEPFWRWYVAFIGDFICVYEATAGRFAREDAAWSEDAANVEAYEACGRVMSDVMGKHVGRRRW